MAVAIIHLFLFVFFQSIAFRQLQLLLFIITHTHTNTFDLVASLSHLWPIKILIYLHTICIYMYIIYRSKDYELILMKHSVSVSDTYF